MIILKLIPLSGLLPKIEKFKEMGKVNNFGLLVTSNLLNNIHVLKKEFE